MMETRTSFLASLESTTQAGEIFLRRWAKSPKKQSVKKQSVGVYF